MPQQKLLAKVIQVLSRAGIDYMITGSIASSLHGEPRSTHDIDIVVALAPDGLDPLADAFRAPDYFLDLESARESLVEGMMFNLIAVTDGDKVDFWPLSEAPFDRVRFSRKVTESFHGVEIKVASPEDTILSKLQWSALAGGSEKQFQDALHVYEVQRDTLDMAYIEAWIESLQLASMWTRLQREAEFI